MEDRSALFNQLKEFSQRKLKKVETKVVTASGEQLVEKRGAKGLQVLSGAGNDATKETAEPPRKLDLQVGLVVPGFLIGSSDVAHDKSSLDSYGVTHILNLASDVENKFEDDYNYKNVSMRDEPDYQLDKILDDCFDYIDDGRHYGNVLIHCSGTIGLSRSTTICIAYLMNKEKQKFAEAFNNVKEVRSFVKPNEGFVKQLKEYEVKLLGAQEAKDSGIDDPFAWRKKQEIEQEKAMVAGAASVKNRMKMFGANLDTGGNSNSGSARSKSVSPAPTSQPPNTSSPASKWSTTTTTTNQNNTSKPTTTTTKSMTPEPRKSWRSSADNKQPASTPSGPPPPPPPMPTNLMSDSGRANKSNLPPPPPPPPVDSLLKDKASNNNNKPPSSRNINKTSTTTTTTTTKSSPRKPSISSEQSSDDDGNRKMVFGRRPPPPMKIRGGHSIERQDSNASDKTNQPTGFNKSLNLICTHHHQDGSLNNGGNARDIVHGMNNNNQHPQQRLDERCPSPLVLMNNVPPQFSTSRTPSPRIIRSEDEQQPRESPFKYWQQTTEQKQQEQLAINQAPKRTVSLGPRRQVAAFQEALKNFNNINTQQDNRPSPNKSGISRRDSFNKAANDLQSSLSELNKLIETKPQLPGLPPQPVSNRIRTNSRFEELPTITTRSSQNSPPNVNDDEDDGRPRRWQWQEDLENWKSSSSVNDLRSMFDQRPKLNLPAPLLGSSSKPPVSASPSVLRRSPWQTVNQQQENNNNNSGDYTIRRTISTSSSSSSGQRPVLRNPYRNQNWS